MKSLRTLTTLPNIMSGLRLALAPVMLVSAVTGRQSWFIAIFVLSLLTDTFDGFFARRFHQSSRFGSILDSLADGAMYIAIPVCVWFLWPHIIIREKYFIVLMAVFYAASMIAGIIKYKRMPSYHTWMAKIAAVFMGVSLLFLFIFDFSLFFRIAAILQIISSLESIGITAVLSHWECNVPSLRHAIKMSHLIDSIKKEMENGEEEKRDEVSL